MARSTFKVLFYVVTLQNRIIELEEDAQRKEERHIKQMREMKSAYEQQNSKLSEFVDFVKRYFPYVEKLMPTIKFLRDTLNFGDAAIRKLCTFKDVSIRGELYSREFNRHFKADGAVCSLKQDTEGKFELNIDGLVQTKERRVYGNIGNTDKDTKSGY